MTGTESSSRGKRRREQVVKDALGTLDWDALQAHLDELRSRTTKYPNFAVMCDAIAI
jgi:hypothetical protein